MDSIQYLTKPKFVVDYYLIKMAQELNLSLNEFLILVYFQNSVDKFFDLKMMANSLGIAEKEILNAFNLLISKKILTIETKKDVSKKMTEVVSLNNLYQKIIADIEKTKKQNSQENIFQKFEREFGRTISSMEYEIISAWIEKGYSEELISCALKEAVYNGVNNLRYIDKILYEWQKKGIKSSQDVIKHLTNYKESKNNQKNMKELFDYNWLEDDSE